MFNRNQQISGPAELNNKLENYLEIPLYPQLF